MRLTKRRPASVGEILLEEFLEPLDISQRQLSEAIGVHRNAISRLIHEQTALTAPMAVKLAAALGTTPEFWLNIEHARVLWESRNNFEKGAEGVHVLPQVEKMNTD